MLSLGTIVHVIEVKEVNKEVWVKLGPASIESYCMSEGDGWCLQKFHEHLHVPYDMSQWGSLQGYDAGPGERSLKTFAKKPAKTAQKSRENFLFQVSYCLTVDL